MSVAHRRSTRNHSSLTGLPLADPVAMFGSTPELDEQEFRDLLAASACCREPICVFGTEAAGQWAEVYEREAHTLAVGHFVVRLVVRDAGQYLVMLDDLPGLLAQLERLAGLLAPPRAAPRGRRRR